MAVSKLIIFLMISMAFVLTVRCQQDDFNEDIETVDKINDQDQINPTAEPGKKGIAGCVKEKVKKVVEKGKQVLKAAGDAISKGYQDFKAKAKEIVGKKQPDAFSSSTPSDLYPSPQFTPSESYPPSPIPSGPFPPSQQSTNGQQNLPSQSPTDDQFELIDVRQKFQK